MNNIKSQRAALGLTKRRKEGAKIRFMREMMGWSQPELGEKAALTAQQVSNIERGRRGVGPDIGPRLAKAFEIPEAEFRRMLTEDETSKFTKLWFELHHTIGVEDLVECFIQILKIKQGIEKSENGADAMDHLKRQVELLARLVGTLKSG